jgi:MATE family multidrug resistance protein
VSRTNPYESPQSPEAGGSGDSHSGGETWWSRPCGGRDVLAIALPLVVQTAFWSIMWFIDRMYLTWYSADAMAASLPAGMLHWTMIGLPQGVAAFANTFVAQYYGAGRHERIGLAVNQGIWFGWLVTPLFFLSIPLAPYLLAHAGATPAIVHQEVLYFQTLAIGAGAVVIAAAQSAFYTGRGLTAVVMVVNIGGSLVNIGLDWVLIFGKLGFPELGIAGAGLATAAANWSVVLVFWLLMRRPGERAAFGLGNFRFDRELFRRLMRYGVPSGLPMLVEGGAFTLLIMQVSQIGQAEAAATSLAFNVNAVAFVPLIGLSIAVSTLVGQKLGENRPDLAERATWTAIVIGMLYTGIFAALYLTIPDAFMALHASQADPAEFAPVRAITRELLKFVALYCFFDALQILFVGALKGAGDTRFVLINAVFVSAIAIVVGRLGRTWLGENPLFWWWWVMTGWIFTLGVVYCVRFVQGRWQTMRVIEPNLQPDDEELVAAPCEAK